MAHIQDSKRKRLVLKFVTSWTRLTSWQTEKVGRVKNDFTKTDQISVLVQISVWSNLLLLQIYREFSRIYLTIKGNLLL